MTVKRSLLAAAVIGALSAAPAFANDSASHAKKGASSMNGSAPSMQSQRPDERTLSGRSETSSSDLLPCSSYKNPNAGKLADKDTGAAREHSASPVHKDCIDDSTASSVTSGSIAGSTQSGSSTAGASGLGMGTASFGTTNDSTTTSSSGSLSGSASTSGSLSGSASSTLPSTSAPRSARR